MKHIERINEPMLITAESFRAWIAGIEQGRHVEYPDGWRDQVRGMEIMGGVAVIPVHGSLGMNLEPVEVKYLAMTDMASIADEVKQAAHNDEVHAIVFDIDSGGGTVNGTPELAHQIADVEKPTFAFTATKACSAAYYIAAAADNVIAAPSATVGHVGTLSFFPEYTRRMEEDGVKVNVFESDPLKTMGLPFIAMSDEQRRHLQDRIDHAAADFKAFVSSRRPQIAAEDMRAQIYWGSQAMEAGYIDATASSCAEVVALAGGATPI